MSRPVIITANWKMYKTIEEAIHFVETLAPLVKGSQAQVYLAVPFTALYSIAQTVEKLGAPFVVGAQTMNDAEEGAFTGEIAGGMLKEAGARFVLLGHSERRHIFGEKDGLINRKVVRALEIGLQPVFCIGETEEQRQRGETHAVLEQQITLGLAGLSSEQVKKLIVAYEPVWAIGTGKVASPEDAEAAHLFCRNVIASQWGEDIASQMTIQYGGSVKPGNAASLVAHPDVDGLLVGGASLSPESFSEIVNSFKG